MKYVDEFRDPERARALLAAIEGLLDRIPAAAIRPLALMEICGGHTHAIFRHGLDTMLPPAIEFVHGPGCPVCVLPMGRVDDAVAIAETPGVIFTTFGDALRVPGSRKSLAEAKAGGADVRMVYSPLDALGLARAHPEREVVFFALGFETTMPSTALTVMQAKADRVGNFSLFCNHITIVPTLAALLDSPDVQIDGFLGPGHVSVVIGSSPYEFVATRHRRPLVVTGFEPLDVLQGVWMVLSQLARGEARVENQYARVSAAQGNPAALAAIAEVFEPRETFEWRGLGSIAESGVQLRAAWAEFDAERRFAVPGVTHRDPEACQCGEVLRGALQPYECRVFGTACTPETPMGALMVSSEGACAAHHRFGRLGKRLPILDQAGARPR
ncbi:hydrogenase formation protein HypD [Nannocystaceae bacterium ST9]